MAVRQRRQWCGSRLESRHREGHRRLCLLRFRPNAYTDANTDARSHTNPSTDPNASSNTYADAGSNTYSNPNSDTYAVNDSIQRSDVLSE